MKYLTTLLIALLFTSVQAQEVDKKLQFEYVPDSNVVRIIGKQDVVTTFLDDYRNQFPRTAEAVIPKLTPVNNQVQADFPNEESVLNPLLGAYVIRTNSVVTISAKDNQLKAEGLMGNLSTLMMNYPQTQSGGPDVYTINYVQDGNCSFVLPYKTELEMTRAWQMLNSFANGVGS